ncbi:aromatic ring-hydroxylating oxygenase subunit alpha [Pseudonocardia humida]|uniref:Aromatic ring-hydroxylating dioxygenase subunit alpha n=1 Tax=Pseudonocardia humida TaxID=2800819 RepID=A0ABT0ZTV4_9PSEU|nr:aromatic ring-hydroxylating dioxygenase subunit alpha [Pseudonocardia humida]MCO1654104.1 aromatic ring-hydroxylating dioxygenase subunit alpha [Pseudonocardia humida]
MTTSTGTRPADDVEVVRRVLAHIDAGTTDEGESWREPVGNYLDPGRFAAEMRLLRSTPSVFVPSAAVPGSGDHVERVAFGVPLFAVRDRDGRARVFRNSCRHRGVALVEGPGCSHALVCRYHGWTYRLDGSLSHVPHPGGFPDLDPSARGLVEVPSAEVDGLIVIAGVEPGAPADLAALADGAVWRDKLLPASRLFDVSTAVRPMNWKVLVEQFLEGYHIRTTHRETFYPLQYDNLNVIETFGPNSRITYPYRAVERLRERPEETWTVERRLTFLYQLFPNVMIATFPDRVVVVVVDPVDVDHTTVTSYALTDPAVFGDLPGEPTPGGKLIADGLLEDDRMSAGVQRGLHAGANEFVEFGRHESAIGHFHRTLTDRLDGT